MVSDRRKANLSNGNGASTDDETRTKPYHDEASPGPSEDRQTATTASHDEADKGPTRKRKLFLSVFFKLPLLCV